MLENNYITCKLEQRTGNLMFQIAHAYAKALEYDRQFILPKNVESTFGLQNTLFRKLHFGLNDLPTHAKFVISPFEYTELTPSEDIPTVFSGYCQSEKFFKKHKTSVKDLFYPPNDFVERVYNDLPFIKDKTVAAINVRRGDYLFKPGGHPVITIEYINEALKYLPSFDHVIIMSDDIEWCKENIILPNAYYNETYWDHEGLWLLSLCHHYIISNSTFSWWGSYLSRNPYKVIVAPDTWFGPEINVITDDIYCDNWIKIKTEYDNGKIVLKK
jgi:hypothetical protein